MKIYKFPNGMTVAQLKKILSDWPEISEDGTPTEVWIETGSCLSSAVIEVCPLNKQRETADLILVSGAFE